MSHAGTAIAGNLGLCRLRCLWRCIKPHPVAMFFVRPIPQFENCGLWIPALRPRKPELGHLGASQRCWMLWDAMGCYGLGRVQVTSGPMVPWLRCNADRMVADSGSHRCHWDALKKIHEKWEILKLHQLFLNPELFVNLSTIKINKNQ